MVVAICLGVIGYCLVMLGWYKLSDWSRRRRERHYRGGEFPVAIGRRGADGRVTMICGENDARHHHGFDGDGWRN